MDSDTTVSSNFGLKCLYTNLDTFHNKKNELMSRISDYDPDVIGLTEIKPKMASWELSDTELLITGYTSYTDLTGRGVALYVKDSLLSKALKPTIVAVSRHGSGSAS